MSIPISSTSSGFSVDRTPAVSRTNEYADPGLNHSPQLSNGASDYTKVDDLKQAGLRGEHYSISDEQLVKAIERAIQTMQGKSTDLKFSIHEKTKMIAVKIVDRNSGEVLREIPPEKSLDFVAKLWEMAGILIDERR